VISVDRHNEPDDASLMDLLLIGDGSKYIDLSKARVFDVRQVTYYRSMHGVWVRQEAKNRLGEVVTECEAFKQFMNAGMFTEAQEYFKEQFAGGSEVTVPAEPDVNSPETTKRPLVRFTIGGLVGLLITAYVVAVIAGTISPSRQVSIADLGVIVIGLAAIAILVRPQLVRNIQIFELGTVRVQLRDLQDTQKDQKQELDELRFTLNLLVTDSERKHLENLDTGRTSGYKRNDWLQAELRRLRSIGLITSARYISEMPAEFDLREWGVELTPYGTEYLRRWKETGRSGSTS
jgi:hypothetical protein